jgi:gamma-glutamylcyclotransferase (GGCT)/AIG2-like uncharacterized protein YtfP
VTDSAFHLFAYGTLQSSGAAADLLQGCQLLGRARVGGVLYDIDGEYPALVLYGNEPVSGEVWRCPWQLLARLDEYEGVGVGLFRRVAVQVQRDDAGEVPCWTYVAGPRLAHKLTPERRTTAWPANLGDGVPALDP